MQAMKLGPFSEATQLSSQLDSLQNAIKAVPQNLQATQAAQVKLRDEFTHHNSGSLKLIQAAISQLKALPSCSPDVMIMGGSLLSSTGNVAAAEKLFLQAKASPDSAEKALACFNLFLVRLRNKDYVQALADFKSAINIDKRYALHDVDKYPMISILGSGAMPLS